MYLAQLVQVLGLPQLFVSIVEGTEGEFALGRRDADALTLVVGEAHPLHIAALTHALRLLILLGHAVHRSVPDAHESRGLAVGIVLVRATAQPFHVAQTRFESSDEAQSAEVLVVLVAKVGPDADTAVARHGEGHLYRHISLSVATRLDIIYYIDDCFVLLLLQGHPWRNDVALEVVAAVVADAAEAVEGEIAEGYLVAGHDDRLAIVRQFGHSASLFAHGKSEVLALNLYLVRRFVRAERRRLRPGNMMGRLSVAQQQLFAGNFVSRFSPNRLFLQLQGNVQMVESFALRHIEGQVDEATVGGLHLGQRSSSGLNHAAVAQKAPVKSEMAEGCEAIAIADAQFPFTVQLEVNVLIDLLHFDELRRDVPVGRDDAVATEIIVVRIVAKATAIVHIGLGFSPFAKALVHPIPDASAYHALAFELNVVPIFLKITDGIAHGVCIFAEEEGASLQIGLLIKPNHVVEAGIHTAVHVGNLVHSFVMDEAIVQFLYGLFARDEVLAAATFVAHAPEDNARMVAVAQHHAHLSVDILCLPLWVLRETMVAVAFNVCLVHHIDAVIIVKGVHTRVIRIVARADSVEVVAFHQEDIFYHAFHRDGFTIEGMSVVAVGSFEHDALAVDEDSAVAVLYLAETVLLCVDIAANADVYGVEVRGFCCPKLWVAYFKGEVSVADAFFDACDLQYGCLHSRARRVHELHVDAGVGLLCEVLEGDVYVEEGTARMPLTIDH